MQIINWQEILYPYEQAVDELIVKFTSLANEYKKFQQHSPIENIEGRVKTVASTLEKIQRKNIPLHEMAEKIEDIAGVRIICKFVEDIAKVILLIRERDGYDLEIIDERDYVTNTKSSGYRSYHIHIKYPVHTIHGKKEIIAEIQIRTLAMNFWATIEHSLNYKYGGNIPHELKERLIGCAEAAFKLDTEMSTIQGEIMEAQKIIQIKTNLVDSILNHIQKLYYVAKLDKMDSINKKFFDLYQEGNVEKLYEFNEQLNVMSEIYKTT